MHERGESRSGYCFFFLQNHMASALEKAKRLAMVGSCMSHRITYIVYYILISRADPFNSPTQS